MRTFASLQLLVSNDDDQRQKLIDSLLSFDDTDAGTSSTFTSAKFSLAPSAADVPVQFGGVTNASLIVVVASQECTVKLDGTGSPAVPVRPIPAASAGLLSSLQRTDQPGVVYWRGKVTSIHLGNPSSVNTASVFVAVVGEAT